MSIEIKTEIRLILTCDAGNDCQFRGPNEKSGSEGDWGGSMCGGFDGPTKDDVIAQAKKRGWLIAGNKAICPNCVPMGTRVQLVKPFDDQDPIDLEIFL